MSRHIDLEGVENCRDFGGYGAKYGHGLKSGLLYRSASLSRATEADLATLQALGLRVIVDLRRKVERDREPSRRWADFQAEVIDNDIEGEHKDWAEFLAEADLTPQWFRQDSLDFYRQAPLAPRHVDLFSRYFRRLAVADGPILVHCAAGKDRTGMICAFTHHIAGVHRDDILADYLLTNDEARISRRAEYFAKWVSDNFDRPLSDAAARTALSVSPEYLESALDAINEAHGSLDSYIETVLGVDAALRDQIHRSLLG
jgi:protein-tyrosine phosphatase